MTGGRALAPASPPASRSRTRLRRALVAVTALPGAWLLTAAALLLATPMFEILAWQPLHRGDYEGAEPFLEACAALSRAATWIRVPGQRLRLARYLGDLAEAREDRAPAEAGRLYRESIAILEAQLGSDDSQVRFARWRYRNFLRSTGDASGRPRSDKRVSTPPAGAPWSRTGPPR